MGEKNSSLTRVQPVFNALLDRWPTGDEWLPSLLDMARTSRPHDMQLAFSPSRLDTTQAPESAAARLGVVFERVVAPPAAFLEWLLQHPDSMQPVGGDSYGASSPHAQEWRRKLFSPDPAERQQATNEG